MGVKITVKGSDFSARAVAYVPKVSDGLQYLNFFGKEVQTLARNLAPGKPPGIVVGSPVFDDTSASFSYLKDYVKTGVLQTQDATLIAVFKVPLSNAIVWRHIVSNFGANVGAGLKYGLSLALKLDVPDARGTLGLVSTTGGAATTVGNARPVSLGSYVCLALTADSVGRVVAISNLTASSKASATYVVGNQTELNGEFLIGSAAGLRSDSTGGVTNVCYASIYNRPLSAPELVTVYEDLKKFYSLRGISI